MKRIFIFTSLFFLVVGLGFGCVAMLEDDIDFECDEDGDCPSGQLCKEVDYSDICKPADWCTENGHCSGSVCDQDTNECAPQIDGYCDYDSDCESNEECNDETNMCYVPSSCLGYDGSSDCCDPVDPCGWADDNMCDCDGACSWDDADCA